MDQRVKQPAGYLPGVFLYQTASLHQGVQQLTPFHPFHDNVNGGALHEVLMQVHHAPVFHTAHDLNLVHDLRPSALAVFRLGPIRRNAEGLAGPDAALAVRLGGGPALLNDRHPRERPAANRTHDAV
eukprot:scaffold2904_cov46-Prasinocladus_malaysianus.AAC.1